jgi:hypothetical protein
MSDLSVALCSVELKAAPSAINDVAHDELLHCSRRMQPGIGRRRSVTVEKDATRRSNHGLEYNQSTSMSPSSENRVGALARTGLVFWQ